MGKLGQKNLRLILRDDRINSNITSIVSKSLI